MGCTMLSRLVIVIGGLSVGFLFRHWSLPEVADHTTLFSQLHSTCRGLSAGHSKYPLTTHGAAAPNPAELRQLDPDCFPLNPQGDFSPPVPQGRRGEMFGAPCFREPIENAAIHNRWKYQPNGRTIAHRFCGRGKQINLFR